MNTFMQSKETVTRNWYVIDAKDIPLGRVAAKAASMLRGKHKATYTPHVDCGDNIIIINAKEVLLTGNKLEDKKTVRFLEGATADYCQNNRNYLTFVD